MATIYSVLLGRGNLAAAGVANVTVSPASGVIVVRSISLLTYAGTTSIQVYTTAGAVLAFLNGVGGAPVFAQFNGRWVLPPSDTIDVTTTGGGGQWNVSGYLLD